MFLFFAFHFRQQPCDDASPPFLRGVRLAKSFLGYFFMGSGFYLGYKEVLWDLGNIKRRYFYICKAFEGFGNRDKIPFWVGVIFCYFQCFFVAACFLRMGLAALVWILIFVEFESTTSFIKILLLPSFSICSCGGCGCERRVFPSCGDFLLL